MILEETSNNPKVSVIIPTYNHASFVGQAVESVLAQTYRDYELLVIDDGSTDDTREILKPYMDRIRYLHQPNAGESRARNRGIEEARGEYIAFLDADDFWAPERLERQVPVLESKPEVALVYSDAYRISTDGSVFELWLSDHDRKYLSGHIFAHLLCWPVINSQTVLVRKSCFERVGTFDETLAGGELQCEDYEMWLRIASRHPVIFVDEPLAYSREHGDNQSLNTAKSAKSQFVILKNLLESNEWGEDVRAVTPLAFSNIFYHAARDYYTAGMLREARKEAFRSLRYTPFRWDAHRLLILSLLGRRAVSLFRPIRDRLFKARLTAS